MKWRTVALVSGILAAFSLGGRAQETCRQLTILDTPSLDRIEIDPLTATNAKAVKFKGTATLFVDGADPIPLKVVRMLRKKTGAWKYVIKTRGRAKPRARISAKVDAEHASILAIRLFVKRKGEKKVKLKRPDDFLFGPCPPERVRATRDRAPDMFRGVAAQFVRFMDLLPTVTDPVAAAAAGITFEPDPAPGAPPHAYVFEIPWDADDDGENDETMTGTGVFSGDPSHRPQGFTGRLEYDVEQGLLWSGAVAIDFVVLDGGWEITGGASLTLPRSGYGVHVTFPQAEPLTVMTPTTGDANLCSVDVAGPVEVEVRTPAWDYAAIWRLYPGLRDMLITHQLYTPALSAPEPLPDARDRLSTCEALDLSGWEGVWRLDWSCDGGVESGASRLTMTASGSHTVEVRDEHPVGSGKLLIYTARADPGDPHTLRGYFETDDGGGTYRENFVYTLKNDGEYWLQNNAYEFLVGGGGGTCLGSAHPE